MLYNKIKLLVLCALYSNFIEFSGLGLTHIGLDHKINVN